MGAEGDNLMDSAGGHGINTSVRTLNETAAKQRETRQTAAPLGPHVPEVQFITQPSRSPDCNALDLAAWFSFSSRVERIAIEPDSSDRPKKMIHRVKEVVE